ncbi:MAG: xanthine dehydrogenase family protein molybdopterin-binding subunit [Alphaproteobacteria bacterium]|nr:xanthine dehydrogenase family protein molybdopterin-binding subunit [Alphaproteobacteria bacterium]
MLSNSLPAPVRHLAADEPSRRSFMIGAAAVAGGLAVGFRPDAAAAQAAAPAAPALNPLQAYLRIGADNSVTVLSAHMDMGQGIYHGLATLVAEELGADMAQMKVEGASGDVKAYGNLAWGGFAQGTGGSTAIASSFERYRRAGAAARLMLVNAAAAAWNVPAGEIKVAKGKLTHASGKLATFGQVAAKAATLPVPTEITLKDPKDWTLIGNPAVKRLDSRAKTTGKQPYTIDVKLPGMLTAVMLHPPLFGAVAKSIDASKAKSVKGFVSAVMTPRGVAVVGKDMWSALQARDRVAVTWDDAQAEKRGSAELVAEYTALAAKPGTVARKDGDAEGAFAGAAKVIEATYAFPYLAHAAMEPLNAVARMNKDGTLEVWGGHQIPDLYAAIAAKVAGVAPDKVRMRTMMTGGGFGRRAVADGDIVVEAVAVAKALGWKAPVKVQWTRENDMQAGRYRPLYVHAVKAAIDAAGNPVAWSQRIVGQSIAAGTPFEGGLVKNGVDGTSVEGASNLPYAIPNLTVELHTTKVGVPILWWRSVGSTHTAFSTETMLDELAKAAGKDPVEYRRALLAKHPRHLGVLNLAAEKAGWGKPLPAGKARGIAVHESFHSYVAQVAEVTVDAKGGFTVDRVICAVDCGIAINPDVIKAQMEGGIGFGLGAALAEAITLEKGRVQQSNFHDYTPLRIDRMPKVEVHIVPSTAAPTGVGEPGVPPIAPAVANALFAATGKPVRSLPFLTA